MGRKLKLIPNIYGTADGFYGIIHKRGSKYDVGWESCRELFHSDFAPKRKRFAFVCEDHDKVKDFIFRAEKILGLGRKFRCRFEKTDNPKVLSVVPGPFWVRRKQSEVLTILLRVANKHYQQTKNTSNKNFWFACEQDPYLKQTWGAFVRFMGGETVITPHERSFDGWVETFRHCGNKELNRMLTTDTASKKRKANKRWKRVSNKIRKQLAET